jgi:hypothetical protein
VRSVPLHVHDASGGSKPLLRAEKVGMTGPSSSVPGAAENDGFTHSLLMGGSTVKPIARRRFRAVRGGRAVHSDLLVGSYPDQEQQEYRSYQSAQEWVSKPRHHSAYDSAATQTERSADSAGIPVGVDPRCEIRHDAR